MNHPRLPRPGQITVASNEVTSKTNLLSFSDVDLILLLITKLFNIKYHVNVFLISDLEIKRFAKTTLVCLTIRPLCVLLQCIYACAVYMAFTECELY